MSLFFSVITAVFSKLPLPNTINLTYQYIIIFPHICDCPYSFWMWFSSFSTLLENSTSLTLFTLHFMCKLKWNVYPCHILCPYLNSSHVLLYLLLFDITFTNIKD